MHNVLHTVLQHGRQASRVSHVHGLCLLQKSTPNLEGAFKYLKASVGSNPWTPEVSKGVDEAAGVGVVVTPEQIKETIAQHIDKVKSELLEQRCASTLQALHACT